MIDAEKILIATTQSVPDWHEIQTITFLLELYIESFASMEPGFSIRRIFNLITQEPVFGFPI